MPVGCITDDTLGRFLEGGLDPPALASVEAHIDGCPTCGPRLLELAREHHRFSGAAPEGALLARGSTVGRFVVLELTGRGAFGTVYAAYDPQLDRRIALKVLDAWLDEEPRRLMLVQSEARGLARVNHPNVVTIHEAGVDGGVPFVAMEFVVGTTLTAWLAVPRAERAIVEVFLEAGRGLAAVHEAGLVHGDFRTDNVLIGEDGRVRITDFGLSALRRPDAEFEHGTAAADQRAFCFSLQRALEGASGSRWRRSRRVRAALTRGLSSKPSARFPSLAALLAELVPPRPSSRWWGVALGVAAAAVVVFARGKPSCEFATENLAGTWDPPRRAALERAFKAVDKPFAPDALRLVLTGLDEWSLQWLAASKEACLAAARGTDAPLLSELRTSCLSCARDEVSALVSALTTAQTAQVMRAPQAVQGLTPLEHCADARRLLDAPLLPVDADERRVVRELEAVLVRARSLRDVGRLRDARAELEPLLARAREGGHGPSIAAVAFELGATLARLQEHPAAVALLDEALHRGVEARADGPAAHAAVLLVYERGVVQHHPEVAFELAAFAQSLTARIGDRRLAAGLTLNRALVAETQGRLDEAFTQQQQAVREFELAAPQSAALGNGLSNLARVALRTGRPTEARDAAARARALLEKNRGPNHPNVGVATVLLATLALEQGALDEAEREATRAHEVTLASMGPTHPELGESLDLLARIAAARGEVSRAAQLAGQALGMVEAGGGDVREPLVTLAEILTTEGRTKEAALLLERARQNGIEAADRQLRARWALAISRGLGPQDPKGAEMRALAKSSAWSWSTLPAEIAR